MSVRTVYGRLLNPGAAAPTGPSLTIALVDYDNRHQIGFNTADQTEVLSLLPVTVNADGTWTVQLLPNSQIRTAGGSTNTAWRITEAGAGDADTYWIVVPAGDPAVTLWVGSIVTTLVGGAPYPVPINFALAGNLSVAGLFTYDGVTFATPPNDATKFLGGDGHWYTPGGISVTSVNGHTGVVVLNSTDVGAIPTTAEGAANGVATLNSSSQLTTAQLPMSVILASRLDQFAAPTGPVAMGSQKLTGGAAGTAGTDFAIVSQLPGPSRDRRSAMLGLLGQPFDFGDINDTGLGLTTGFLILMLCDPDAGTGLGLNLFLGNAGSGVTGASNVCAFTEGGNRVALSADVSTQLSNGANSDSVLALPFASSLVVDGLTPYYVGVFCQMSTNPTIGGVFASLHPRTVNGHRPAIVIGGLSSVPATINVSTATTAGAAYWFGLYS